MPLEAPSLRKTNVLLFEPESVAPAMRVGLDILKGLKQKVTEAYEAVLSVLVERGFLPSGNLEDLLQTGVDMTHPFVTECLERVPKENRFYMNTDIYYEAGVIPHSMETLRRVYRQLAPEGIHATLFNTAGGRQEYEALAAGILVGEFPVLAASVWIATDCPYAPMPDVFRQLVTERKVRRKGHMTVTDLSLSGGSYTVALTDKPGKREAAVVEAVDAIYRRLSFMRGLELLE